MADYFARIAREWHERAPELAEWTMRHLVNRTDVWGRYVRKDGATQVVTAPFRDERGKVFLDHDSLTKHFRARTGAGVLGLHAAGADRTARWFAIDIDLHDPEQLSVTAEGNFSAALAWRNAFADQGFDPLLIDSNGAGGFHLWMLFAQPLDAGDVFQFAHQFTSDFLRRGLDQRPEVFPNEPRWDHYGYSLRLFGRHHTHEHFSRVWNDEPYNEQPWLEGHEAIDRILATRPLELGAALKLGIQLKRRTVCLDFDGVLHSYRSGWCGSEIIPDPPIHGTREAVAALRKSFRVVVHSARCHSAAGRAAIQHWLRKHDIEVDEVCEHKPPATVYVDDRAVPFRGDWDATLIAIHEFRR